MARSMDDLVRVVRREGTRDPRILEAFRRLDRAGFVPEGSEADAYYDHPVAIPERQTTSQPSLIARMIEAAAPGPDDRVLEIGTGYGYQTALLALLAKEVVSIERWDSLAETARRNLARARVRTATVIVGDGWQGYPERGPYDAIVVSAAAEEIPPALVEQLVEGGRLVIPVRTGISDDVVLFEKGAGALERIRLVTPARFVPLIPGSPGPGRPG